MCSGISLCEADHREQHQAVQPFGAGVAAVREELATDVGHDDPERVADDAAGGVRLVRGEFVACGQQAHGNRDHHLLGELVQPECVDPRAGEKAEVVVHLAVAARDHPVDVHGSEATLRN